MTTADPVLASRPTIDPVRWPDLAASRAKVRRGVESAVARQLFRSAARRLAVRVETAGEVFGGGEDTGSAHRLQYAVRFNLP